MTLSPSTCSCEVCQEMCRTYSCLPTPKEAKTLIEAGYGNRLMLDVRADTITYTNKIFALMPAMKGFERELSPTQIGISPCTFLTAEGLCEIQDLKPTEGLYSIHDMEMNPHADIELIVRGLLVKWRSLEGREVSDRWIIDFFRRKGCEDRLAEQLLRLWEEPGVMGFLRHSWQAQEDRINRVGAPVICFNHQLGSSRRFCLWVRLGLISLKWRIIRWWRGVK